MQLNEVWQKYLAFTSSFMPQGPKRPTVGIDIGTSSIKAVTIARVGSGFEIKNFHSEPLKGQDPVDVLQRLKTSIAFDHVDVATSVSGKGTLMRYVDMPRMSLDQLRKAFAYELDKYFPFEPTSIYYDCHILDENKQDKKMSVMVAAVKKELVDSRLEVFKKAGIALNAITTNAVATVNAFTGLSPELTNSAGAKAILDIGGAVSTLIVVFDRTPRFTRDIFMGSGDMMRQAANVMGIEKEALEEKMNAGQEASAIFTSAEDILNNLVSEVRLSLDYFITERNIPVDEMYIVGGGARLQNIDQYMSKNLGINVSCWQPLAGMKLSSTVNQVQINAQAPQLTVALGLGINT